MESKKRLRKGEDDITSSEQRSYKLARLSPPAALSSAGPEHTLPFRSSPSHTRTFIHIAPTPSTDSDNSSRNSIISNLSETSRRGSEDRPDIDMGDGAEYDPDVTVSHKYSGDLFLQPLSSHRTSPSQRMSMSWYEGQPPSGVRRLSFYSTDVNEALGVSSIPGNNVSGDLSNMEDEQDGLTSLASSQLSRLKMDVEQTMEVDDSRGGMTAEVRKQRARSGAVTGRTFSMGYRADCEKCRMRIPGHSNHILYS